MFNPFKRKPPPAPLTTVLSVWTTTAYANYIQEQVAREQDAASPDPQKLLGKIIFAGIVTAAGSFLDRAGKQIGQQVGNVGADALAFELLAFTFYAVRESHLPTPDDPLDDNEPEELVEGYRFAMGALPHLIAKQTGWDVSNLWERRVMFYFQRPDMKDATEAMVGTVLTMKGAQEPARDYGPLSLDLKANVGVRLLMHTYASQVPKGIAETIHETAVEFGLIL